MSNLREVRKRISSIKSTRQITAAMKMVAASKLHRSQQSIVNLRTYAMILGEILHAVNRQIPYQGKHPLTIDRGTKNLLLLSIASNKGLCGLYNVQVLRRTVSRLRFLEEQKIDCQLFLFCKKNENHFRKKSQGILDTDHEMVDRLSHEMVNMLAERLIGLFNGGEFDRIEVIYHRFKNAVVQDLVVEQLLPLSLPDLQAAAEEENESAHQLAEADEEPIVPEQYGYILEPDRDAVINELVRKYLCYNLYRVFTDASASEHGARMTSMHKATDNADRMIKELTLTYNKVRQAVITREIMEIVGGAEK